MLTGDYAKAKEKFRECLKQNPSDQIKGMVLNNLALAYYWQKYPKMDNPDKLKLFKRDSDELIENEFATIPQLFKDSIRALEGINCSLQIVILLMISHIRSSCKDC